MMSSLLKDLAEIGIAVGSNDIKVLGCFVHGYYSNTVATAATPDTRSLCRERKKLFEFI